MRKLGISTLIAASLLLAACGGDDVDGPAVFDLDALAATALEKLRAAQG